MDNITKLNPSDAGCWIDGHWGKYGLPRLLEIAQEFGWSHNETLIESDEYYTDILCDLCDEAENWLNDNVAPEGFMFGWNDGEFFLWSNETWEDMSW